DGVTIFVSTHFMNEAERCDRVSLMHAGRVLVTDAPAAVVEKRGVRDLEEAFIAYLEEEIARREPDGTRAGGNERLTASPAVERPDAHGDGVPVRLRRLLSYTRRESLELRRDPIRLTLALLGSVMMMLVLGYGISMDVEDL